MQVHIWRRRKEEVGLHALREEPLARLFCSQDVAIHLYPYLSRSTLMAKHVQLPFRSLTVSSKAEQFKEEGAPLDIRWPRPHLLIQLFNSCREVPSLEKLFSRHRTSPIVPLTLKAF
jgi:hypothetical protein